MLASLLIFLGAVSATTSINNTMTMNDENTNPGFVILKEQP
ncbi:hypothetical protein MBGDF03_01221, partial [Thermoplasmatales archaeon SCGC AB-540-F20]